MIPSIPVINLQLSRDGAPIKACLALAPCSGYTTWESGQTEILSPREAEYLSKIRADRRKRSYFSGRMAAKLALSSYLSEPDLSRLEIIAGIFDQPLVFFPARETPEVTISHSDTWAVAIAYFPGHIMGVDIEDHDLDRAQVVKSQLTAVEIAHIDSHFASPPLGYYLAWTAKEALSKTLKCGLTTAFSILETHHLNWSQDLGCHHCHFQHFGQYQSLMWQFPRHTLAITLPKKTVLNHPEIIHQYLAQLN